MTQFARRHLLLSSIVCVWCLPSWDGLTFGASPTNSPKCKQDFPHTLSFDSLSTRNTFAHIPSFWFQLHSSHCCIRHYTLLRVSSQGSTTQCTTEVRHLLLSGIVCVGGLPIRDGLTSGASPTNSPRYKQDLPHTLSFDSLSTCSTQQLLPLPRQAQQLLPPPWQDTIFLLSAAETA